MVKIEDFNLDNILKYEKSCENILVYNISYKTLIDVKHFRIRFNKIDGFIIACDGTRYLVLFESEKCDLIYNIIRNLIGVKSGITYVISQNYAKIKVDSYYSLPLEKTMTFHNVIVLIKLAFNKDKYDYYYDIFLEKVWNELSKKSFCIKYKCFIMIELKFLKELMLIRQMNQESAIFVVIGIF